MELDSGFHICKGFLVGVAFSYYYAIDADGISNIAVEMLFYYYFYRLHLSDTLSFLENKTMLDINRLTVPGFSLAFLAYSDIIQL